MFYSQGGKPINSGGYGCVFKPALRCRGEKTRGDGISKLMTREHAESEYNGIMRFADKIREIPNYQDYFVLEGVSLCTPMELTKDDLSSYNNVCKSLARKKFNSREVNSKLDELGILNLPDAGIDLDNYILSSQITPALLDNINRNMTDLLVNAIKPMNELDILHMDMKGSNIMVDTRNGSFKIIDWGLADIYDNTNIPLVATGRPIQYNTPFSCILFNDTFQVIYTEFIANSPNALDSTSKSDEQLNTFIINFYFYWSNTRGSGHHDYINTIVRYIINNSVNKHVSKDEFDDLINYYFFFYLVSYISPILKKYTKHGRFQDDVYFREVYAKNVDVWGTIMSYEILLPLIYGRPNQLTDIQKDATYNFIVELITKFLYDSPTVPIDIKAVVTYISNFTNTLMGTSISVSSIKSTSSKSRTRKNPTLMVSETVNKDLSPHEQSNRDEVRSVIMSHNSKGRTKIKSTVAKHTEKRKRCPNGTHWNKSEKRCKPKYEKRNDKRILRDVFGESTRETPVALIITEKEKHKRCPSGTRRNKKTGRCEPKEVAHTRTKKIRNVLLKKEHLPEGMRRILQN